MPTTEPTTAEGWRDRLCLHLHQPAQTLLIVRDIQQQARQQGRREMAEEAAKVCDTHHDIIADGLDYQDGAKACADAIRRLAEEKHS